MSSRHLIDPEILPVLDMLPPGPPCANLAEMRAGTHRMVDMLPPPDIADVTVAERQAPGPSGAPPVRVLIYMPRAATAPMPGYLQIHGGGYVAGLPELDDPSNRAIAHELGGVVVSVDYRLAPENPFPRGIEDCYAALKWLHREAPALGVDPQRIAVGGESAGGGLAAALALLARDRGEVPLVYQSLLYPMIDDRTCAAPPPYGGEFIWTPADNLFGWTALLGGPPGGEGVSCYAAAARAEKLEGLPPAFIATGALDLFCAENILYARRLIEAGVPAELHVYPGAFHAFDLASTARVARALKTARLEALRRALSAMP
jgi:acetyl esterase/lipase